MILRHMIITNKKKIPNNHWSRYGVTDQRWRLIYIVGQVLYIVGGVISISGTFLGGDKHYIAYTGSFLFILGFLPLIAGSKSEKEDEYGRILRKGMVIFCVLGVIALPVMYFITLIW